MSQGTLYVVSAPSGAGKTSLVRALCERFEAVVLSVSHTTRQSRTGEEHGVDYFFTSVEAFEQQVAEGDFLEHAKVFDNYYGTSRSALKTMLEQGQDVILEIDWQGARQVREQLPDTESVFILPPSREALEERLQGRGQDGEEIIARRMQDAVQEMSHYNEYGYVIINDDFSVALDDLEAVFRANRLKSVHQIEKQAELIRGLLA